MTSDLPTRIAVVTAVCLSMVLGYLMYIIIDNKTESNKAEQVKKMPALTSVVDSSGRLVQLKEYCVNGIVYFGNPMAVLYDRDGKVVPCQWEITNGK